jgi:molybdopterin/thiamine biosynthesis adenylyltransferase
VVVDGTDNMGTRYIMNDACLKVGIPWVYGGAVAVNGMSMTILPGRTPCLRCVFRNPPPSGALPTSSEVGVLNTLPSVIGSILATEALKVIVGANPRPGLLVIDVWTGEQRILDVKVKDDCPACQLKRYEFLEG